VNFWVVLAWPGQRRLRQELLVSSRCFSLAAPALEPRQQDQKTPDNAALRQNSFVIAPPRMSFRFRLRPTRTMATKQDIRTGSVISPRLSGTIRLLAKLTRRPTTL